MRIIPRSPTMKNAPEQFTWHSSYTRGQALRVTDGVAFLAPRISAIKRAPFH